MPVIDDVLILDFACTVKQCLTPQSPQWDHVWPWKTTAVSPGMGFACSFSVF